VVRKGLAGKRGGTAPRRSASGHSGGLVVPLDAEDIALARLQAQVRRTETIRTPPSPPVEPLRRRTVPVPPDLVQQTMQRARRDGVSISDVVAAALKRYLRSRA
jgi:hypothetical protein